MSFQKTAGVLLAASGREETKMPPIEAAFTLLRRNNDGVSA